MRVLAKKTLREFWEKHKDAEQSLKAWYSEASKANWKTPHDIKKEYVKASKGRSRTLLHNANHQRKEYHKDNYQ